MVLSIMQSLYGSISSTMASIAYFEILISIFCIVLCMIILNNCKRPINYPILGMLPDFLLHVNRVHEVCTEVLGDNGGTFLLKGPWFTNLDILGTVDPENVHYIMSSNFSNFPKGTEFKKIFDVLGDGIFNSDLELWKSQRNLARGLIIHQRFYRYLVRTSSEKVNNSLVPVLNLVAEQGRVVDLQDVFQRFTFDTTCKLVTGYDPGCLSVEFPDVPFSKAMDDAEEVLFMRHLLPESLWKLERLLGIGMEKKMSKAWETLDQVIGKYIAMKHQELVTRGVRFDDGFNNDENEEGFDLLTSYIVKNNDNEGLKFDSKFLRDTILNFMIAGRDTTSSALTWFVWLVSTHPEVEKRIREELVSSISPSSESGKKPRLFRAEETKNLIYLHAAMLESLRLYPPVPFQHKSPLEDDVLPSGHRVRSKSRVMFSLYAMGRMEFIWGKDAAEFRPERWISERGTIRHEPSYKFLAFNAGPRTCLGKEVAFTQIKAVAAAIIHNYQVSVVKNHDASPNVSIILYMKHGLKVHIKKRWT